jgi:transcriptional regulator with XRE-family HTH domain
MRLENMSIPKVSIRQIKAARSLIGWSQNDLADRSGVSIATVKRLEAAEGELGGRNETSDRLLGALEAAGVEFTNGGSPGVRLAAYQVYVAQRGGAHGVMLQRGIAGKPEWLSHADAQVEGLRARRAGDDRLANALSLISQAPAVASLPDDEEADPARGGVQIFVPTQPRRGGRRARE